MGVENIKIEPSSVTWDGTDVGCTEGDLEVTLDEQVTDIVCHQTGTQLQGQLRTGKNVEVAVLLQETSTAQLDSFLAVAGGTITTATAEVTDITTVADVAGALDSKYFTLYAGGDAEKVYVWADVDAGGNDPAPSGYDRGISYAVTTGDSATVVAGALETALTADAAFSATDLANVVTVTTAATGPTTDATDVDSGFTFSVTTQGAPAVTGWGTQSTSNNTFDLAKRLVLHPVSKAASDTSDDITFWKAYPVIDSLSISGENPRKLSVTFKAYPDDNQDKKINIFAHGDVS